MRQVKPMLIDESGGDITLLGVWDSVTLNAGPPPSGLDNLSKILAYLDDTNAITNSLHSPDLLHNISTAPDGAGAGLVPSMVRRYMKLLKEEEYDFEYKNRLGTTPLLDHCSVLSKSSLATSRLLLEFGADIRAVDNWGRNALHRAMGRYQIFTSWNRKLLEPMLSLLIKAGADVNHCNGKGDTPSDTARKNRCWKKWCRVLKLNSLDISEVMIIDREQRRDLYKRKRQERGGRADAEPAIDEMPEMMSGEWDEYSVEGSSEMWYEESEEGTDEETT